MTDFREAFARLDAFVERRMTVHATPAMAVALTDRERLLHVSTFGFRDLAAQAPVTPETLFQIGSIGKSFTAMMLLQLRQQGQVDLDAPITDYLPWFEVQGAKQPITLHHLLTHTAGIVAGVDAMPDALPEVWALRRTTAGGPPGERFHYSNVGYKTIGLVIEQITGEPYRENLRRLLTEFGMPDVEPAITHRIRPRLAVGYVPLYDDRPFHSSHPQVPATWLQTSTADGSIAATPADLATYLRALLNRGAGTLSEESFALMTRPVIPNWEGDYGYGLNIRDDDGQIEISHAGGMVGYYASMRGLLDDGLGAVAFCTGWGNPFSVTRYAVGLLRAALAGQPLPPAPDDDGAAAFAAAEFAGRYVAEPGARLDEFTVTAEETRCLLHHAGEAVPLEYQWADQFVANYPLLDRFALRFIRDGDDVVAAVHGGDWYAKEGTSIAAPPAVAPPEWTAFTGTYRAHNPWTPVFKVVLRRGQLWLIFPAGAPDGFDDEQSLMPLANGEFHAGEDAACPERLGFDTVLDGSALHAVLSGADYWRA